MSADKHRRLALEVAYLRLAARECGIRLNVRWGRGITPLLDRMIAAGDLDRRRMPAGGRKTVTTVFATPRGLAKLTAALARFGDGFGPVPGLVRIEPVRRRKDTPPLTGRTPAQARQAALCLRQALERARAKRLAA